MFFRKETLLYLAFCLPLLTLSCSKEDELISQDSNEISAAKSWFETQHVNFLIDWDEAKYNKQSDRVIAPLIWNAISEDGPLSMRKLSISGNRTGNRAAKVIEIVPSKAYYLKHGNKYSMNDFEGTLAIRDLNLKFQRGEYYKNGERQFPAIFTDYPSREAYTSTPHTEGCTYTQTAYYSGGVLTVIGSQYCGEWYVGGSGGNTSGNGTEPPKPIEYEIDEQTSPENDGPATEWYYAHVEEVVDSLRTPCFKTTLSMVVNGAFTNAMNDIIDRVFHYNEALEVTVMEDKLDASLDGTEQSFRSGMFIKSTITLNQSLATASKEYVAATLLHEACHSYFSAKNVWPLRDANNVQHNVMANEYVSEMAGVLQHLFPNLPAQDAINLAWGGLGETLSWKAMAMSDPAKINSIIATNNKYKTGTSGTKCQ